MPLVKFVETRVVQDEHRGTARETRYVAGETYDLPEASAARWIARGVGVLVGDLRHASGAPAADHDATSADQRPAAGTAVADQPPKKRTRKPRPALEGDAGSGGEPLFPPATTPSDGGQDD